ncbi:MAG TPA: hypothetical protein VJQ43_06760, partial [Thermoplasmata archaeon]|nr:hypothetical protein [Thermoplasmata archaeon]
TAAQVGFTQDLGGLAFIDGSDLFGSFPYTCLGHETSAHCSYPWYSYSCATQSYNFGATDYPTTTSDFGKDAQYRGTATWNAAGEGYYPGTNDTVPACGAPTASLAVTISPAGAGRVTFLNRTITGTGSAAIPGVHHGDYSLAAWAQPNYTFVGWFTSGSVAVGNANDAYTSLAVSGSGSVTALFQVPSLAASAFANVTFASATPGARFSVATGFASDQFGRGHVNGTWEVVAGTTLRLAPGLYSIEGQPPPAYNFTGWTTSAGGTFSAPDLPDTILDVTIGANVTVSAAYAPTTAIAKVVLFAFALNGTFVLNGTNYTGLGILSMPVGTYTLSYIPSPGGHFLSWQYGGSAMMTNFSESTRITFEAGTSDILPFGYSTVAVTLNDTGADGEIAWNATGNASAVSVPTGTTVVQNVTGGLLPAYGIVASAKPGWTFQDWSVNDSGMASFLPSALSPSAALLLNTSRGVAAVTLTAHYVAAGSVNLSFAVAPIGGGAVTFGYNATHQTSGTTVLAPGLNGTFVVAFPNPGYVVSGVTVVNATAQLTQSAGPTGRPWAPSIWYVRSVQANATLTATFVPLTYPVTFVADSPAGTPTATLNGTVLNTGETIWLPNGTYSLSTTVGAGSTFVNWTTSWPGLTVTGGLLGTNLTVRGPGTVYALESSSTVQPLVSASTSPTALTVLPGASAGVTSRVVCLGNTTCPSGTLYRWSLSNGSVGSLNASTGPSVRFTAAIVYASTDLVLDATWNGSTVEAMPIPVAVVPALTGATIDPVSSSIYSGQSVLLGASLTCTANLACPLGGSFQWSVGAATIGTIAPVGANATDPSTALFTASPSGSGVANVSLLVGLNGQNASGAASVSVALPLLTGVAVNPGSVSANARTNVDLRAAGICTLALLCPGVPVFAWSISPARLGSLNATSGDAVTFTAGALNASGWLNVTGTLNGVTAPTDTVAVLVVQTGTVLTSVTVAPASASLSVGSAETFSALLGCQPSPCPSGAVIVWAVAPPIGTLSTTSGPSTTLTASAVGTATVYANATLNGTTVGGTSAPVTVVSSGGTTSASPPIYENPLV